MLKKYWKNLERINWGKSMRKIVLHNRTKYIIAGCMISIIFLICMIHIKQEQEFSFLQTVNRVQEITNVSILHMLDKVCRLKESLFSVMIEKNDNSVIGENQKIVAEIYYEQPVVSGSSDGINKINEYFEMEAEGWIHGEASRLTWFHDGRWENFNNQLDSMREMYGDDILAIQPCRYTVKTEFIYQNEQYICFKHVVKYQTGGPSVNYCFGTTFDKNTGEIVPINEIVEIDGEGLKEILIASYREKKIHKTREEEYEELIEVLYGNKTLNNFIITDGEDEIQLNYEYYYDGELFYLILNGELNYNDWWEVGWNGKTGSEMKLIFPTS